MHLRKAVFEDKKDILKIADLLYFDISNFIWNTDEFVDRQINNGEYFVAEREEKIIGIVSFRPRKDKMYIETLAVTDGNQSEGVGTRIIEFAKNHTKERGFNALCCCSFFEYKKVDFYLLQGFSLLDKPGIYNNHKYYRFEMKL